MRAITAPKKLHELTTQLRRNDLSIGFVATMGALHEGHMALIKRSQLENDKTIVSIFVNPLQFDNPEDLERYPRDLELDKSKLAELGVETVFLPDVQEIYEEEPAVSFSFGQMDKVLEGAYRAGHFSGVAIVVCKLFQLVQPHRAYFGMKDLQQFAIIKRMVQDLSLQVEVVGVDTLRESSGLAMSSRNLRLSKEGQLTASKIHEGLQKASNAIREGGDLVQVKELTMDFLESQDGLKVEYLEVVNPNDFSLPPDDLSGDLAICFAGYVEGVRLIDNLYLPA